MYIRKSVQYKLKIDLARQYKNVESFVYWNSNKPRVKISLLVLFTPPPPPPDKSVDGFIDDITSLFSDHCMNRYECYIMGDFHLDMFKNVTQY